MCQYCLKEFGGIALGPCAYKRAMEGSCMDVRHCRGKLCVISQRNITASHAVSRQHSEQQQLFLQKGLQISVP